MSTLVTTTVQATTLKKDASTTNATLNANGTMTMGNEVKTGQQWNSAFKIGILNNDYATFSSFMDSSHASQLFTAIHLVSPRIVYISWYFYRFTFYTVDPNKLDVYFTYISTIFLYFLN